jgi:hypothetical protein
MYDVQYRQPTKVSDWMSIPHAGVKSNQAHEKQTVTTRADAGSTISDGWFRLSFGYNGVNGFDSESRTLTARIPYSATADQMQEILQRLENVNCVFVRRSGASAEGGYTWQIEWMDGTDAATCPKSSHPTAALASYIRAGVPLGSYPLLALHSESIAAPWSGSERQVVIARTQKYAGATGTGSMCTQRTNCVATAKGLDNFKYYHFRVRAHNSFGWGEWSGESDPTLTQVDASGVTLNDGSVAEPGSTTQNTYPNYNNVV